MPAFIFLRTGDRYTKVNLPEILYIEANKNYCKVYTTQRSFVMLITLKQLADALPEGDFLRIHRSFLVALGQVTAFDRRTVYLAGKQLPLGETYRNSLEALALLTTQKPRSYAKSTRSRINAL
jgi:two-component system, LytTR family, response regulator